MVSKSGLGVSVIICCYNSAIRLPETLKHLALQNANAELNWEIIIVDNASSDDTSLVARKEWGKYRQQSIDFKVVDQPIVGLSNAREKGIMSAKYEYVLFCDDDNWLFDNYVETAFNIMSQDSSIGVLGGCGLYEPELPVNPEIASHTGYYVNGKQTWAETDHWVYGAGATYRKSVYMDLKNKGWQQLTSDRIGDKLSSGGDVEICFMIYLSGYKILADERLLFKHFVPSKRQKTAYIIELSFWLSYTTVLLTSYYTIFSDEKRPLKKTMND